MPNPAPPADAPPAWRLPDVIDYELFLDADERVPAAALRARDRELAPVPTGAAPGERRQPLRRWLEARRGSERQRAGAGEIILPGEAFAQVLGAARVILAVLGLVLGWGAAAAALAYTAGAEPINAFTFFVGFALAQLVLVLFALGAATARHLVPGWRAPSLMRATLRVLGAAAGALWRRGRTRLIGAGPWAEVQAGFGVLRRRGRLYGRAYAWRLVRLAQVFAVAFNLGVLGAMTTRHLFHDLDFGWESTWLDAGAVHRTVQTFARPWAAFVTPAHPSLAQVEGSQIRKRDPARLESASLKSWSHFLFAAVLCYGLLPRVLLLGWAARAERAALRGLRFTDGRSEALLDRLRTPAVESTGVVPTPTTPPTPTPAPTPTRPAPVAPVRSEITPPPVPVRSPAGMGPWWLNLSGLPVDPAASGETSGAEVLEAGTLDPARDEETFARLARRFASPAGNGATGLTVLFAGWTAPTVAVTRLLDRVRASAGSETLLRVNLLGKPAPGGGFRLAREADRAIWARFLDARADPYLLLLPAATEPAALPPAAVS